MKDIKRTCSNIWSPSVCIDEPKNINYFQSCHFVLLCRRFTDMEGIQFVLKCIFCEVSVCLVDRLFFYFVVYGPWHHVLIYHK